MDHASEPPTSYKILFPVRWTRSINLYCYILYMRLNEIDLFILTRNSMKYQIIKYYVERIPNEYNSI